MRKCIRKSKTTPAIKMPALAEVDWTIAKALAAIRAENEVREGYADEARAMSAAADDALDELERRILQAPMNSVADLIPLARFIDYSRERNADFVDDQTPELTAALTAAILRLGGEEPRAMWPTA